MSRHAAPSLRRSRYSFTPAAPWCLTRHVCDRVRSSSPSLPFAPWETVDALCSTAVEQKEHMNDFRLLRADRADIQPFGGGNPTARLLQRFGPSWAAARLPKMVQALKVCADEAQAHPCTRLARNPAASARTCAAMRRIGVLHAGDRWRPIWCRAANRRGAARGHDDGCPEGPTGKRPA